MIFEDGVLFFKLNKGGFFFRRIVDFLIEWERVFNVCYNEMGYKGWEVIYV